ncbi:MAG: class I SAM-dependent methyltransferase [Promethearchaeota archaeon]
MDIIYEVFNADLPRQGPGDNKSTKKAFSYLTDLPLKPFILDVGCGNGMQTLELARLTNGRIIALDNHQPYLDELDRRVKNMNFSHRISTINQSMLDMKFDVNRFDIIWSEGAAYIYGFEKALKDWQFFLKEKGYLVISELCWFKENHPKEIHNYLMSEYPVMKSVKQNKRTIDSKGLELIFHFNIPESSWWDNYYIPVEKNINKLHKKYQNDNEALELLELFKLEIEMFKKYSEYYGYTFFIMRKK